VSIFTNNRENESVAFVILNVKGKDLVAIDEQNKDLEQKDIAIYEMLGLDSKPLQMLSIFILIIKTSQLLMH